MRTNPKLLILGNARHGKDTFAEILRDRFGLKFVSSSQAAADIFIYDSLKTKYGYKTPEECFEDRMNHRQEWYEMICDYNKNDRARLAKGILSMADCYVGMRDRDEIDECMNQRLFDIIIWVDASERLPLEDGSSFNIDKTCATIVLENNETLEIFERKAIELGKILFNDEPRMKVNELTKSGGLLNFFKNTILNGLGEDELDLDEIQRPVLELLENTYVNGWPSEQDMENHEIITLDDHGMTIICGGDWQAPKKIKIIFDGQKLHAVSVEDSTFYDGLDDNEVLKMIGFSVKD
jgi:hypothetical protein